MAGILENRITANIEKLNGLELEIVHSGVDDIYQLLLSICRDFEKRGIDDSVRAAGTGGRGKGDRRRSRTTSTDELTVTGNDELENEYDCKAFVKLQERVECNITVHLMNVIMRHDSRENEFMVVRGLRILQGTLLLHPGSRHLFGGGYYMNQLISFLDNEHPPAVVVECVLLLVSVLVRHEGNIRTFERLQGLEKICSLVKDDDPTRQSVRIKSLEFLFFYLVPNRGPIDAAAPDGSLRKPGDGEFPGADRRILMQKVTNLKHHLNEEFVDEIVREFLNDKPFGDFTT